MLIARASGRALRWFAELSAGAVPQEAKVRSDEEERLRREEEAREKARRWQEMLEKERIDKEVRGASCVVRVCVPSCAHVVRGARV